MKAKLYCTAPHCTALLLVRVRMYVLGVIEAVPLNFEKSLKSLVFDAWLACLPAWLSASFGGVCELSVDSWMLYVRC